MINKIKNNLKSKAESFASEFPKFLLIIIPMVLLVSFLYIMDGIIVQTATQNIDYSHDTIRAIANDINSRIPSETDYTAEIKNYIGTVDSAPNVYAQAFSKSGNSLKVLPTQRLAEESYGDWDFSAVNDKALLKLMLAKQSGSMTVPYGSSGTINIAFEWVPDMTNADITHHQYLLVVGEVNLVGSLYANVIVKFIIITLLMTVVVLAIISYQVNCRERICR